MHPHKAPLSRVLLKVRSNPKRNKPVKNGIKANLSERDRAIFNFAYKLSETPPTTTAEEIFELRNQELDDLEILDLVF